MQRASPSSSLRILSRLAILVVVEVAVVEEEVEAEVEAQ